MATTLAESILSLFRRFNETASKSTPQKPVSVYACWLETFATKEDRGEDRFYDHMVVVQAGLNRLADQVSNSTKLDEQARQIAHNVLGGLNQFAAAQHLQVQASQYASNLTADRFALLTMLASTLRDEYPEPTVPPMELGQLLAEIKDLQKAVQDSAIPGGLKDALLHQIAVLIWTIQHSDWAGELAIKQKVAEVAILAQSLPTSVQERSTEKPTIKRRIAKFCDHAFRVLKIVEETDTGLTAIEHLKDFAADAIDVVT